MTCNDDFVWIKQTILKHLTEAWNAPESKKEWKSTKVDVYMSTYGGIHQRSGDQLCKVLIDNAEVIINPIAIKVWLTLDEREIFLIWNIGKGSCVKYYKGTDAHREDGPAILAFKPNGTVKCKEFVLEGKRACVGDLLPYLPKCKHKDFLVRYL